MDFKDLSITFHTDKVGECAAFYVQWFGAKLTFDCGWYATVQLSGGLPLFLSFMTPQTTEKGNLFQGGATLNLKVDDVDAEYEKSCKAGLKIVDTIADHEWGDRSFTVKDPVGNVLYIYSDREITGVYKEAVK